MINQQAVEQNEADDRMVVDPHPFSQNSNSSDTEWDWEDDHSSQRVEQSQDTDDSGGTEQARNEEHNGNEGEQMLLADRLYPEVPAPRDVDEEDADGWCMIDKVGA